MTKRTLSISLDRILVTPTEWWRMQAGSDGDATGNHTINPVTQHLLAVSLEQDHMNRQIMVQELASLCTVHCVPAAVIPIPDPTRDAQCLLSRMKANDDIKEFLTTFKQTVRHED